MSSHVCHSLRSLLCAGAMLCLFPASSLGAEIRAQVLDRDGQAVADAVVVALPETPAPVPTAGRTESIIVDQVNKEFIPYVLPIRTGTAVNFPNQDNIRHHVYSFSKAKRFELPLYIGDPATPITFDKPGVVALGCNIHDWMIAYIYVSNSPYFARTGADGSATLGALPPGRYKLSAWHPRLQGAEADTEQQATVSADEQLELSWQIGLKPAFRIRRAPIPGRSAY